MRRSRDVLPYAGLAVVIVTATVVALALGVYGLPGQPPAAASPTPTPVPTAPPRALTDLSANGRLAYWRDDGAAGFQLWVANADNSRRRVIAKADVPGLVSGTRWSPRGDEVAYITEGGGRLVVARVDGVVTAYVLAPELRADGWRITDHRLSPSGARVAATVQRSTGSQTDVFLAASNGTLARLTTTEDVVAADWISEDELLVNTTGGVLARLRASGTDQLRPITSLPAATPQLGPDGRVYFLSGRVVSFAGSNTTLISAAAASVWSVTVDGDDLRRERELLDTDGRRLDGFWPGSGFLVHRSGDPSQAIAAPFPITIPTTGGAVERLEVAADGTYAIGLADTNVVRFDLSPKGEIGASILLLGAVTQADAWFPRTTTVVHAAAPAALPAGKYAFSLGGSLWLMRADGVASLLRPGNTNALTRRRFALPPPVWSPKGDRLLVTESLGQGASAFQLVPTLVSLDGTVRRFTSLPSVAQSVSWSPDGQQITVTLLPAALQDPTILATALQVHIVDAALGTSVRTIPGREAYWTKAGIVVLSNGTYTPGSRAREEQTIGVWSDGELRTITTVADLRKDPRFQAPPTAATNTLVSGLEASADGAFVSVHLSYLGPTAGLAFAVLRASDGLATFVIGADGASDEAWSPTAASIGYTTTSATVPRAIVRDASTGSVLVDESGRFAGWSADGTTVFVARDTGLYARRLGAQSGLARVSAFGVPMGIGRP